VNQNIEKLILAARISTDQVFMPEWDGVARDRWEAVFREKYAELIVLECSRIAELKEQGFSEYDPNMSVGWYMRNHFGVK
jgi:hypothetical protein